MLYGAFAVLMLALIVGALAFAGLSGAAADVARIVFFFLLAVFVLILVEGILRRPRI